MNALLQSADLHQHNNVIRVNQDARSEVGVAGHWMSLHYAGTFGTLMDSHLRLT